MALDGNDRVVGYIVILLNRNNFKFLQAMAVAPDMIGQGVSSGLLKETHERYEKYAELRAGIRERNDSSMWANKNAAERSGRGFEVRPWPPKDEVAPNHLGELKLIIMRRKDAKKPGKKGSKTKRGQKEEGDDKEDDDQEEEEDGKTQEDDKEDDGGSDGDKKPAAE